MRNFIITTCVIASAFLGEKAFGQSVVQFEHYYNLDLSPDPNNPGDYITDSSSGGYLKLRFTGHPTTTKLFAVQATDLNTNSTTTSFISVAANSTNEQTFGVGPNGTHFVVELELNPIAIYNIASPPVSYTYAVGSTSSQPFPQAPSLSTLFESMEPSGNGTDDPNVNFDHRILGGPGRTQTVKYIPNAQGHTFFRLGGFESFPVNPENEWTLRIDQVELGGLPRTNLFEYVVD